MKYDPEILAENIVLMKSNQEGGMEPYLYGKDQPLNVSIDVEVYGYCDINGKIRFFSRKREKVEEALLSLKSKLVHLK